MLLVLLIACLKGNFMFLVWVLDRAWKWNLGCLDPIFDCPLPKNHLLGLSCVWLVVPYLRGLIVTTSLLQTGLRSVCTASPADSSTGSLSVVCCSALLTWELKSPACCLSSSLSLGLFGRVRALLHFKSWKMSVPLFCGLLVGHFGQ